MKLVPVASLACVFLLSACASGPPELPYPAFVQVDELNDIFMASLPGVRAKQLAGDPQTRRTSNRVDLPPGWKGTTGGTPGRSLEIFVVKGELSIADVALPRGGYAYLPAGSLGFNLGSDAGAQVLYFLNDVDPDSMIRSPLILNSQLVSWEPTDLAGVSIKELRMDPGNSARTWLLKIATGATLPWQLSTGLREGYFLSGSYQHTECVDGQPFTWQYLPGGYFYRPANVINAGPEATAMTESVWFLRETKGGKHETVPACEKLDESFEAPATSSPTW